MVIQFTRSMFLAFCTRREPVILGGVLVGRVGNGFSHHETVWHEYDGTCWLQLAQLWWSEDKIKINRNMSISLKQIDWWYGWWWTYLDWMSTSTMASAHITVTLCNSITNSQITIFTIHIVCAGTWIVTQPDTEILDFGWWSFVYLFQWNDFTRRLLEFFQLSQEIPETGFGHNVVWCKNSHLV